MSLPAGKWGSAIHTFFSVQLVIMNKLSEAFSCTKGQIKGAEKVIILFKYLDLLCCVCNSRSC